MKYLLKLVSGGSKGHFEVVDKFTFDNRKFALSDDGTTPRYCEDSHIIVDDAGKLDVKLESAEPVELSILVRGLACPPAPTVGEPGFLREPSTVKFLKGKIMTMLELKSGEKWTKKIA